MKMMISYNTGRSLYQFALNIRKNLNNIYLISRHIYNSPPLLTEIIEEQATQLLKAAFRFFVVAPDLQCQACYVKSYILEGFGQKWKTGLRGAIKKLKITKRQLHLHGQDFYPEIWCVLVLFDIQSDIFKGSEGLETSSVGSNDPTIYVD